MTQGQQFAFFLAIVYTGLAALLMRERRLRR